jgi:DNA-binding transcriptional ArsR family regulator
MSEKKTHSTTEVLDILNIERTALLYHMRLLRGLLKVPKDDVGRYEFTKAQVEILRRHLKDNRKSQKLDNDGDDVGRFLDRIRQLQGMRRELTGLLRDMGPLLTALAKAPAVAATIHTLPLAEYRLVSPIRALVFPHRRQFRASFPEARLQVQEVTRENALLALRADLLRAYLALPASPPIDDPQATEQWHVLHALIAPAFTKDKAQ